MTIAAEDGEEGCPARTAAGRELAMVQKVTPTHISISAIAPIDAAYLACEVRRRRAASAMASSAATAAHSQSE
jgi:hypothetical protein